MSQRIAVLLEKCVGRWGSFRSRCLATVSVRKWLFIWIPIPLPLWYVMMPSTDYAVAVMFTPMICQQMETSVMSFFTPRRRLNVVNNFLTNWGTFSVHTYFGFSYDRTQGFKNNVTICFKFVLAVGNALVKFKNQSIILTTGWFPDVVFSRGLKPQWLHPPEVLRLGGAQASSLRHLWSILGALETFPYESVHILCNVCPTNAFTNVQYFSPLDVQLLCSTKGSIWFGKLSWLGNPFEGPHRLGQAFWRVPEATEVARSTLLTPLPWLLTHRLQLAH